MEPSSPLSCCSPATPINTCNVCHHSPTSFQSSPLFLCHTCSRDMCKPHTVTIMSQDTGKLRICLRCYQKPSISECSLKHIRDKLKAEIKAERRECKSLISENNNLKATQKRQISLKIVNSPEIFRMKIDQERERTAAITAHISLLNHKFSVLLESKNEKKREFDAKKAVLDEFQTREIQPLLDENRKIRGEIEAVVSILRCGMPLSDLCSECCQRYGKETSGKTQFVRQRSRSTQPDTPSTVDTQVLGSCATQCQLL